MKTTSDKTPAKVHQRRSSPAALKLRRILVPLDFSDSSKQALACAVPLARSYGAKISLVHVVLPLELIAPIPGGGPYSGSYLPLGFDIKQAEMNAAQQAQKHLDRLAAELVPTELTDKKMVRIGNAAHEVVLAANALKADIIVLSTQGHSRLKSLLMGSTAERIVRHANCPVLTVPCQPGTPPVPFPSRKKTVYPSRLPWKKILVPLDFSPTSLRALKTAVPLARKSGAKLLLLNVVVPNPVASGMEGSVLVMPDSELIREAEHVLPQIASHYVPRPVRADTLIRHGRATDMILDAAEMEEVDLIVLTTHGRTGVDRLLLGSTAEQVVRHARCPVYVARKPRAG